MTGRDEEGEEEPRSDEEGRRLMTGLDEPPAEKALMRTNAT